MKFSFSHGILKVGPLTAYLGNGGAMSIRWAVNVRTRFGAICARPPLPWWGLRGYAYVSHNATPWGAWWVAGDVERQDRLRASLRRRLALACLHAGDTAELDELISHAGGDA